MAKYALVYHGGERPETEEEGAKVMAAWGVWMGGPWERVDRSWQRLRYFHHRPK